MTDAIIETYKVGSRWSADVIWSDQKVWKSWQYNWKTLREMTRNIEAAIPTGLNVKIVRKTAKDWN